MKRDRAKNVHHATRQKGLRNKARTGAGSYSRKRKRLQADSYGTWRNGERIA